VAPVLLYLPLVIPALAGLAVRPLLITRLEPRQASWVLTAATAALAACSTAALALLAAYAAAKTPSLAALGDYSRRVVGRGDPVSAATGALAGLALALSVVAAGVSSCRRVRALVRSYRRAARLTTGDRMVVVPGSAVQAYALPGRPGRIVVSAGLLARLDSSRQAAVIAHEQAHLAGRHHLFAAVARVAAGANPMLLPLARSVDYTLERWADEDAAAVTGSRKLVAQTIGQVALLGAANHPEPGIAMNIAGPRDGRAAAGGRRLSMVWAGPAPRRVAALLSGPPRRPVILLAACAAAVLLAGLAAVAAASHLHALIEVAQVGQ
jgi:Zn-dependent protease with chaperone function